MKRRQQASLWGLVLLIGLLGWSPPSWARRYAGRFQNCMGQRLRVYVKGRYFMILEPHKTYKRRLPKGRLRVVIRRMKRPHKVVMSGRLPVKGPGWFVRVGCGRRAPKKGPLVFRGYFRNCGNKTLQIYLDGKLLGSLPPGKRMQGKLGGRHKVRIVAQGKKKSLLQRNFSFRRGWHISWGCSAKARARMRCPKGYYVVRVRGKAMGCCPHGTVHQGAGVCRAVKKRKRRLRKKAFRCPLGYHRIGKTHICCPAGTTYAAGACVDKRLLRKK